uniref:Uncharacterized protein n=1 Tax=Meloidogyne incognita TaxID=6306 RepID=A0A914L681_MELIC
MAKRPPAIVGFKCQLNPPQVVSEAVTYSKVSSEITSIIGATTRVRSSATLIIKGSSQPILTST